MMSDSRKQEILDFIRIRSQQKEYEGSILWDIVADEFSEKELKKLVECGVVYEPILGYIKEA